MSMIEVKTAELSGAALDWAVLIAEGWESDRPQDGQLRRKISTGQYDVCIVGPRLMGYDQHLGRYWRSPSTDWSQGGPLIHKYGCDLNCIASANCWESNCWDDDLPTPDLHLMEAETPLIAACRAIVAAKLGDTVQVPAELVEVVQ